MLETSDQVRERLIKEAESRVANRLQNATSIGASDGAMRDHKFALKRIHAMSDTELSQRATDVTS